MKIIDLKEKLEIKDEKSHIIKVLFDKYVSYLFDYEIILCDKGKMLGLVFESDTIGMYAMFDRADWFINFLIGSICIKKTRRNKYEDLRLDI